MALCYGTPQMALLYGTPQMAPAVRHATDGPFVWDATDAPFVWDATDGPIVGVATLPVWVNKRGAATIVADRQHEWAANPPIKFLRPKAIAARDTCGIEAREVVARGHRRAAEPPGRHRVTSGPSNNMFGHQGRVSVAKVKFVWIIKFHHSISK